MVSYCALSTLLVIMRWISLLPEAPHKLSLLSVILYSTTKNRTVLIVISSEKITEKINFLITQTESSSYVNILNLFIFKDKIFTLQFINICLTCIQVIMNLKHNIIS